MNALQALAQRRQLLVACAVLQRVRLAHEWQGVRDAAHPGRWAAAAAGGAGVALALSLGSRRTHDRVPLQGGVWVARAVALWRLVRALRRLGAAA